MDPLSISNADVMAQLQVPCMLELWRLVPSSGMQLMPEGGASVHSSSMQGTCNCHQFCIADRQWIHLGVLGILKSEAAPLLELVGSIGTALA